jgi:hypothetical protein
VCPRRKKLKGVGRGDDSPMVPTPIEPLRVAQGLVPQPPYSLIGYSLPHTRPDFESQVRCVGEAAARIDQLRAAGGAADAENLLPEAGAHLRAQQGAIQAARAQQQARLLEGNAAALERATHETARDTTEELARAESTLQRLHIEEGEGHAMLVQRGEDLEAREAALRADILKAEAARAQHEQTLKALAEERAAEGRAIYESTANALRLSPFAENLEAREATLRADTLKAEAARAQQEQTPKAPTEARATMDEAAAEGRAMDESEANARGLLQLAERETALRAESFDSEAQGHG